MKKLPLVVGLVIAMMFALTTLSSAQTINACINKKTGKGMRIVTDAHQCKESETFISWGQGGPAGPQGPKGDKGDTGARGATGPQGPPGVANGISRAVHGSVTWDGALETGAGFNVNGVNCYDYVCVTSISFIQPFNQIPTCIASADEASIDTPSVIKTALSSTTGVIFAYARPEYRPVRTGFYFVCFD